MSGVGEEFSVSVFFCLSGQRGKDKMLFQYRGDRGNRKGYTFSGSQKFSVVGEVGVIVFLLVQVKNLRTDRIRNGGSRFESFVSMRETGLGICFVFLN